MGTTRVAAVALGLIATGIKGSSSKFYWKSPFQCACDFGEIFRISYLIHNSKQWENNPV